MKYQSFATSLCYFGAHRLLNAFWGPTCLTVLAYHRVVDTSIANFDNYKMGIHPSVFARQMAYVAKNFNVIDLMSLYDFFAHQKPLPPHPLLITFDDGYLDNYMNAYPILRANKLPAVFFLVPDWIDHPTLPWWDELAYYLHHTSKKKVILPLIGKRTLSTEQEGETVLDMLLSRLKLLSEVERRTMMSKLSKSLDVETPAPNPELFISWEQARELVANGHACQSHSMTHPILTRIPAEEVRRQLSESRHRIISETKQDVVALAYPNGLIGDYNGMIEQTLQKLGYRMAFTMNQGPILAKEALHQPFQIPRISGRIHDNFSTFVLKVNGVHRIKKNLYRKLSRTPKALTPAYLI